MKNRGLSFKHSGNLGDIVYAIPAILAHSRALMPDQAPILYLQSGVTTNYSATHPLGKVLLSEEYIDRVKPLLESQGYFSLVSVYRGELVNCDLDDFRKLPISFKTGCIPYWYFWLLGCSADLSQPWIHASPASEFKDYVLVSRTFRLRSRVIDYAKLDRYASKIVFCGIKEEWEDFRTSCPSARNWVQFDDFLHYAQALKACSGFVGNQGFGFTLAEAMKIPRVLESNEVAPNNSPIGGWFRTCIYQKMFNMACEELFSGHH